MPKMLCGQAIGRSCPADRADSLPGNSVSRLQTLDEQHMTDGSLGLSMPDFQLEGRVQVALHETC